MGSNTAWTWLLAIEVMRLNPQCHTNKRIQPGMNNQMRNDEGIDKDC